MRSRSSALQREVQIRALRASGWPLSEVARVVGCSVTWATRLCSGLKVADVEMEVRKAEAAELLRQGVYVHEIAERLKLATRTVVQIGHELGLPYRRRGERGPARRPPQRAAPPPPAPAPAPPPVEVPAARVDRAARLAAIRRAAEAR